MSDSTFGFIGLGLIGGSIARGLRRANKDITIMAYMRTRSKLEQAKADGHSALLSLRYCNGGEPHGSWSVFNDQWSRNPYIVSSFA